MTIQLTLLAENFREYTSLNSLVKNINKHVTTEEYAVTKKRIKLFKKDVFMKT